MLNQATFGTWYDDFITQGLNSLSDPSSVTGICSLENVGGDEKQVYRCLNEELTKINEFGSELPITNEFTFGNAIPDVTQAAASVEEWDEVLP
jgi:hypothetical protein